MVATVKWKFQGQFSKMLATYSRISFIFSEWVHMGWIVLESLIGLVVEFEYKKYNGTSILA